MKLQYGIFVTAGLLVLLVLAPFSKADVVDLVADPTMSSANVSLANGAIQTSTTSGTAKIDLIPPTSPFGTAQITEMNLIYDDAMTFSFLTGLVTATTAPGDVTVQMVTPGAAGTVTGGQFDQLGNILSMTGSLNVLDPGNLVGGNQVLDLSTLANSNVDFIGNSVVRNGNTITVSTTYSFSQTLNFNGVNVQMDVTGNMVATGVVAIPEGGSIGLLTLVGGVLASRRRRASCRV